MENSQKPSSPCSTAERQFASEPKTSLPLLRVRTPPALSEGLLLRNSYTSSSSDSSEHTPPHPASQRPAADCCSPEVHQRQLRDFSDAACSDEALSYQPQQYASPRRLLQEQLYSGASPRQRQQPATDWEQEQARHQHRSGSPHLPTARAQLFPRASADMQSSTAGRLGQGMRHSTPSQCSQQLHRSQSFVQCPDSDIKLAAARDAVLDLLHRLTEVTDQRDEAIEAASREWHLAELLRRELAATPDRETAQLAASGGRLPSSMRRSRLCDIASPLPPPRFGDTDSQPADCAAAEQDSCFSIASDNAAASDSELETEPSGSLLQPPQRSRSSGIPLSQQPRQFSSPLRHSSHSILRDSASSDIAASSPLRQRLLPTLPPPSPEQVALQKEQRKRSAAQQRAAKLERRLRRAEAVILQMLRHPDDAAFASQAAASILATGRPKPSAADDDSDSGAQREVSDSVATGDGSRKHDGSGGSAAQADALLSRLQSLAQEALDTSRPSGDGGGSGTEQQLSSRDTAQQRQQAASTLQATDTCARRYLHAATVSDLPNLASAAQSALGTAAMQRLPQGHGGCLAEMRLALQRIAAAAVRAGVAASADTTSAPAAPVATPADPAKARVALQMARLDLLSAMHTLACCKEETRRLLSPSKMLQSSVAC